MDSGNIENRSQFWGTQPQRHLERHVLWIGAHEHEFAWLSSRIAEWGVSVEHCHYGNAVQRDEWLIENLSKKRERTSLVIYACASRLDYDLDWLNAVRSSWGEIPLAVACGQWWEGAGRTGIRQSPFVMMPWHRIWDGWMPWISSQQPGMHDAVAISRFPASLSVDSVPVDSVSLESLPRENDRASCTSATATLMQRGLVVAQECAEWRGVVRSLGCEVLVETVQFSRQHSVGELSWLLLDESLADTFKATEVKRVQLDTEVSQRSLPVQVQRCVREVAHLLAPGAPVIVAVTAPTWELWQQLSSCGVTEIITKPTTGAALRALLAFYANKDLARVETER